MERRGGVLAACFLIPVLTASRASALMLLTLKAFISREGERGDR